MGASHSQIQTQELFVNFKPDQWTREKDLGMYELWQNTQTTQLCEAYKLDYVPQDQELQHYRFRHYNQNADNFVEIKYVDVEKKKTLCSHGESYVLTEFIPVKLSDIQDLTFIEACSILKSAFRAFHTMQAFHGPFIPNEQLIGVNLDGRPKIWLNKNHSKNRAQKEIKAEIWQKHMGEVSENVKRILQMVEQRLKEKRFPHEFRQYFYDNVLNFSQASEFVEQYCEKYRIIIPHKIEYLKYVEDQDIKRIVVEYLGKRIAGGIDHEGGGLQQGALVREESSEVLKRNTSQHHFTYHSRQVIQPSPVVVNAPLVGAVPVQRVAVSPVSQLTPGTIHIVIPAQKLAPNTRTVQRRPIQRIKSVVIVQPATGLKTIPSSTSNRVQITSTAINNAPDYNNMETPMHIDNRVTFIAPNKIAQFEQPIRTQVSEVKQVKIPQQVMANVWEDEKSLLEKMREFENENSQTEEVEHHYEQQHSRLIGEETHEKIKAVQQQAFQHGYINDNSQYEPHLQQLDDNRTSEPDWENLRHHEQETHEYNFQIKTQPTGQYYQEEQKTQQQQAREISPIKQSKHKNRQEFQTHYEIFSKYSRMNQAHVEEEDQDRQVTNSFQPSSYQFTQSQKASQNEGGQTCREQIQPQQSITDTNRDQHQRSVNISHQQIYEQITQKRQSVQQSQQIRHLSQKNTSINRGTREESSGTMVIHQSKENIYQGVVEQRLVVADIQQESQEEDEDGRCEHQGQREQQQLYREGHYKITIGDGQQQNAQQVYDYESARFQEQQQQQDQNQMRQEEQWQRERYQQQEEKWRMQQQQRVIQQQQRQQLYDQQQYQVSQQDIEHQQQVSELQPYQPQRYYYEEYPTQQNDGQDYQQQYGQQQQFNQTEQQQTRHQQQQPHQKEHNPYRNLHFRNQSQELYQYTPVDSVYRNQIAQNYQYSAVPRPHYPQGVEEITQFETHEDIENYIRNKYSSIITGPTDTQKQPITRKRSNKQYNRAMTFAKPSQQDEYEIVTNEYNDNVESQPSDGQYQYQVQRIQSYHETVTQSNGNYQTTNQQNLNVDTNDFLDVRNLQKSLDRKYNKAATQQQQTDTIQSPKHSHNIHGSQMSEQDGMNVAALEQRLQKFEQRQSIEREKSQRKIQTYTEQLTGRQNNELNFNELDNIVELMDKKIQESQKKQNKSYQQIRDQNLSEYSLKEDHTNPLEDVPLERSINGLGYKTAELRNIPILGKEELSVVSGYSKSASGNGYLNKYGLDSQDFASTVKDSTYQYKPLPRNQSYKNSKRSSYNKNYQNQYKALSPVVEIDKKYESYSSLNRSNPKQIVQPPISINSYSQKDDYSRRSSRRNSRNNQNVKRLVDKILDKYDKYISGSYVSEKPFSKKSYYESGASYESLKNQTPAYESYSSKYNSRENVENKPISGRDVYKKKSTYLNPIEELNIQHNPSPLKENYSQKSLGSLQFANPLQSNRQNISKLSNSNSKVGSNTNLAEKPGKSSRVSYDELRDLLWK